MGNMFAGSEIVEMGVEIEKNGRDFYAALMSQTKDQKAKDIFKYLAGEEEKHISTFKTLLDSVQKYEPPESYTGEYFAYMKALAGEHVFTRKNKGKEIAKSVTTPKQGVELGIGFEKDSIIFYEGMKKLVPEKEQRVIDELIAQEQAHLTQLSGLKKIL